MPIANLYRQAQVSPANDYLWPPLTKIIGMQKWEDRRAFDLGCGNGNTAGRLAAEHDFSVLGVDMSESGIADARHANLRGTTFEIGSVYDDLAAKYGTFPLVISLEVIEHCFEPRKFVRTFLDLIAPGGVGVLSTPYHGYLKNVALAVAGKMDFHYMALWDYGHIKFFSIDTLRQILEEMGVTNIEFVRVGRIPPFAKSMIAVVRKP